MAISRESRMRESFVRQERVADEFVVERKQELARASLETLPSHPPLLACSVDYRQWVTILSKRDSSGRQPLQFVSVYKYSQEFVLGILESLIEGSCSACRISRRASVNPG